MSHKLVILVGAISEFDQAVIDYHNLQKNTVLLLAPSQNLAVNNANLHQISANKFINSECPAADFYFWLTQQDLINEGELVSVIHGTGISEANIFDDFSTVEPLLLNLEQSFLSFSLLNDLLRELGGNVVFPLYSDALSYQGDDVPSIANHAKKAFMMSYSKEMNPFKVNVNCIVLPHLAKDDVERKKVKRSLRGSVFGMKPVVYTQQNFIAYIDEFTDQNKMMTGQCINFRHGTGLEL